MWLVHSIYTTASVSLLVCNLDLIYCLEMGWYSILILDFFFFPLDTLSKLLFKGTWSITLGMSIDTKLLRKCPKALNVVYLYMYLWVTSPSQLIQYLSLRVCHLSMTHFFWNSRKGGKKERKFVWTCGGLSSSSFITPKKKYLGVQSTKLPPTNPKCSLYIYNG